MRIVLVDDHVLFRKGVGALLASREGVKVVGEAGDGLEALRVARDTVPDAILMDINMPVCGGLEAVKAIKSELPGVKIIMLTISDDDSDLFQAIKNGAEGYLLKNLEPQQLYDLLEGVERGEAAISGAVAAKILKEFRDPESKPAASIGVAERLTVRETQVLERVVEGDTNKEIAKALFIAENTVKIHLRNILEKLHLRNRIQAAVYAVREGLVGERPAG